LARVAITPGAASEILMRAVRIFGVAAKQGDPTSMRYRPPEGKRTQAGSCLERLHPRIDFPGNLTTGCLCKDSMHVLHKRLPSPGRVGAARNKTLR